MANLCFYIAGTDKKVWISKGRVIPKSDMAYLKPDEAQKKIINDFQKSKGSPTSSTTENQADPSAMKVRSKSKLSIKLSKFKKENTFFCTFHIVLKPRQFPNVKVHRSRRLESSFKRKMTTQKEALKLTTCQLLRSPD